MDNKEKGKNKGILMKVGYDTMRSRKGTIDTGNAKQETGIFMKVGNGTLGTGIKGF